MSIDRNFIEQIGNSAFLYEKTYHGCSQCTLRALQDHLALGDDLTFKAASAFAAGVARMGDTCGAVLAGVMAIGLAFGREKLEVSTDSKQYAHAQECGMEFAERFKNELGSIRRREIQKSLFGRSFDLRQPEEREQFPAAGAYEKCPEVTRKAARLAAEIILREKAKRENSK